MNAIEFLQKYDRLRSEIATIDAEIIQASAAVQSTPEARDMLAAYVDDKMPRLLWHNRYVAARDRLQQTPQYKRLRSLQRRGYEIQCEIEECETIIRYHSRVPSVVEEALRG